MSFWDQHREELPYGPEHECVSGHLHSPTPLEISCPKCGRLHTHPYYVDTSEGWQDCPKVPHLTPASVVNALKEPTKKGKTHGVKQEENDY